MVHRTTETDWKSLYEAETRISARQAAEIVQLREQSSVITELSMTWQSIETAPKDGNVLVADSGEVSEAYYDGETDSWFRAGKHPNDFDFVRGDRLFPTHWMPLPAPPTGQP